MTKTIPRVTASEDPQLGAIVTRRIPLLYRAGADALQDRPAHVRAASAVRWFGDRLAVVQDDANFIGLVDPTDFAVESIALPAAADGVRQFDDLRGNKHDKLDLEAGLVAEVDGTEWLLAFGSGSTPARNRIALLRAGRAAAEIRKAQAFYDVLRRTTGFSGTELNLEGTVLLGDRVRLFNRGNGAPSGELSPVDATCDLGWPDLWKHLCDPAANPPPNPFHIVQYDLGSLGGVRLTFTDACARDHGILYTAAAEDSPDAVRDGEVQGSAIGSISRDGQARYAVVRDAAGEVFRAKIEGITPSRTDSRSVWVVVDVDDPLTPSELCAVELRGPW